MAWNLCYEEGYVTTLGSSLAIEKFIDVVNSKTNFPVLQAFLKIGYTSLIDEAIVELTRFLPLVTDINILSMGKELLNGLNKIKDKEVAIISQ